ncbi:MULTISPECIES: alpha/beta hydrolase [Butyricimonas]|uniref:alpha/beta hydrolase n=1 Tax=Butyricimonas TaxID=574697 RepID=UPI001D07FEAC|nr:MULTISPECIES: alpha/beta hydrolase [Butyricimonas]MCB6971511.1 alpha/beta hydrolase [Butyricimonas synergistica]MCG4518225.1 alpha/beta hydrolase [Butyricimonas sp. DFI.6.44]
MEDVIHNTMNAMTTSYTEDILKDGFEQRSISLRDDYEGKAVSVLVRRLAITDKGLAVLYIHGFNDYFFQKEMAFRFNERGIHFYALDLRKYGRSWLPRQKFNDIRDLRTYFEEIEEALRIIREEGIRKTVLMGHSTGGLIITLFAKEKRDNPLFDALVLNSPFFEFNQSRVVRKLLPLVAWVGKYMPEIKVAGGFAEEYGKYLHQVCLGEWDYDLTWKPHVAPRVNLGWVRAIYKAQRELMKPFSVNAPFLILHSEKSVTDIKDKEQIQTRDSILNVEDIKRIARNIRGDVDIVAIPGGLHDLVLSGKEVRENVYREIFRWWEILG